MSKVKKTNINDADRNFAMLDLALICEDEYKALKPLDVLVFTMLKNQESLSIYSFKNGNKSYSDKNGDIFIRISQAKLSKILKISIKTLKSSLDRLEEAFLIEVSRVGINQCNKIYVGTPNSTITFGEYVEKIGFNIDESIEEVKESKIKRTNITDVKEKEVSEVPPPKTSPNENNLTNNSIYQTEKDYTQNTKKNQSKKEEINTDISNLLNEYDITIKKQDAKKCNETFTDLEVLEKALIECSNSNSFGFVNVNKAYKKALKGDTPKNKAANKTNGAVSVIEGKAINDYNEEDFNRLVEEREKNRWNEPKPKIIRGKDGRTIREV